MNGTGDGPMDPACRADKLAGGRLVASQSSAGAALDVVIIPAEGAGGVAFKTPLHLDRGTLFHKFVALLAEEERRQFLRGRRGMLDTVRPLVEDLLLRIGEGLELFNAVGIPQILLLFPEKNVIALFWIVDTIHCDTGCSRHL